MYFFLSMMSAAVILRYKQRGELFLRTKLQEAKKKKKEKEILIQHLSSFLVTNKGSGLYEKSTIN